MNAADGSEQTRLTNNAAHDGLPSLSPDGTKIAFQSNRDGNFEIYIMNADGSGQTNISNHPAFEADPDFGSGVATEPPPPPTPAEAIDELISIIQNLDNVPQSVKTSLTAPLKEASDILSDDNPNNDKAVCGKLGAFINQVNAAERRGTLTPDQADDLRTQAEDIIMNQLDC
jgi:WD40 repeat protein